MNLLILNPNNSASMIQMIAKAASRVALPDTVITALSRTCSAPASVEGHADAALAVPPMQETICRAEPTASPPDAIIPAGFDDPGHLASRKVASAPEPRLAQAAMQVAMTISPASASSPPCQSQRR